MMNRTHPVRRHTRWPARWPILYGNEEFVAKGAVLDVTAEGWRMAGPMPVHPGMRLNLWVWPSERPEGFHIQEATVLWVRGYEFALEVQNMNPIDQAWLTQFLDRALGLWLVPRVA
jgi:hypothetical protein